MAATYKKIHKNFRYNLVGRNKTNKINKKHKTNEKNRKTKRVNLVPAYFYLGFFSFFLFLEIFCSTSAFAAGDLLKDAHENIKANFGLKSVFIKVLYLMEIYYGWRKYRETNNPLAVGSIVVVALALTYAIGKWVEV